MTVPQCENSFKQRIMTSKGLESTGGHTFTNSDHTFLIASYFRING